MPSVVTSLVFASLQEGSCLYCCPVLVQYLSSICPVIYWTCTAQLLHIYCTRFEANPLLTYGIPRAAIIFMKLFKPRNTFKKNVS